MTTPNSELRARLREAIDVLNNNRQRLVENAFKEWHGWYDERDIETVKSLLSDLSRLLTPSDPDTKKALEALAQIEEDAHDANLTESIRTAILSLSAQLAEKEGEIERLEKENTTLRKLRDKWKRAFEETNAEEYLYGKPEENPNDNLE